ncbi:MAG: hypothetical protein JSU95_19655 [Betaproteobacteria bacterium]|nr:MAG: hypothetical protein JSU95_19655 [Betaproteobacteria bacterium]
MTRNLVKLRNAAVFTTGVLLTIACAKNQVAPVDVEYQAFDDLRAEIQIVIDDPAREQEAIRIVNELQDDLAALRIRIERRKRRTRELNANYDVTRAELEAFLENVATEVYQNHLRVAETHRALISTVTAPEREAIARAHTKAMKAAISSIQSI